MAIHARLHISTFGMSVLHSKTKVYTIEHKINLLSVYPLCWPGFNNVFKIQFSENFQSLADSEVMELNRDLGL